MHRLLRPAIAFARFDDHAVTLVREPFHAGVDAIAPVDRLARPIAGEFKFVAGFPRAETARAIEIADFESVSLKPRGGNLQIRPLRPIPLPGPVAVLVTVGRCIAASGEQGNKASQQKVVEGGTSHQSSISECVV